MVNADVEELLIGWLVLDTKKTGNPVVVSIGVVGEGDQVDVRSHVIRHDYATWWSGGEGKNLLHVHRYGPPGWGHWRY